MQQSTHTELISRSEALLFNLETWQGKNMGIILPYKPSLKYPGSLGVSAVKVVLSITVIPNVKKSILLRR